MERKMKTIDYAAKKLGVSARRVRVLCSSGRIPGAEKVGRDWLLPDKFAVTAADRRRPGKIKLKE